ncbi:general stress protein [Metabacillus halosaccharovorans]|uniref:general stress protein n=1 Tax=Metabacillus halosaccharovorans TaxID=930124 RepID=UPI00203EFE27|nr:general stress protein [Metabacillus halosaccharovorans]MCM3440631.1 general stress protein [Metabacillus halosaccharovorans]
MKPYIEEFQNEENLEQAVNMLKSKGVQANDLYVLTHDDDRTERISDKADTNLIGVEETGLTKTLENLFVKKGDEIRNKLHELGFSTAEAEMYEEKLDQGKALLIIKNPEQYQLV